jgi:hypothetical protein
VRPREASVQPSRLQRKAEIAPRCGASALSAISLRRFFGRFPAGFPTVVLAALLDRPAAVFLAGFATDFLTAFFARVFLRGLAARLAAARFRGGA